MKKIWFLTIQNELKATRQDSTKEDEQEEKPTDETKQVEVFAPNQLDNKSFDVVNVQRVIEILKESKKDQL